MEGREVVGGETERGEGGVKEQEGFVKKVGEECWGKGQSRERERTEGSGRQGSDK